MPLKVLHVYRTYYPDCRGGLLEVIRQICIGTRELGTDCKILALTKFPAIAPKSLDGNAIEWCHLDFEIAGCGFSLDALRRFRRLAQDFDVIHYHFPWPFADLIHLLTRPGKPAVVTYHSDIVKQERLLEFYRPLMYRFLRNVDAIATTSRNYAESSDVLQEFWGKTQVIPIGVEESALPPLDEERVAYWRGIVGCEFFLFIGVIRYYKGLHILLDAVENSSLQLVLLGSGPTEGKLKEQVAGRMLASQVHFLGELPDEDKIALLSLCVALVLPSHLRSEAFGVALLEAMIFRKPLITAEIGTGTSFVNVHESTGLIVPKNDPVALRGAMEYLLQHPDVRFVLGKNARERYETLFTAKKMAAEYVALYEAVARSSEATSGDSPSARTVLITGATSQIGRFLVSKLIDAGFYVHAVTRETGGRAGVTANLRWHQTDISHGQLPRTNASILLHLAPLTLLPPLLESNACCGISRIIAFGSTSRFTKQSSSDPKERQFAEALSESEMAIARRCHELGIAWTVFRPTLIYGCGIDKNVTVIGRFIKRFRFFPLIGKANGLRQPVHAADLAEACIAVLSNLKTFNRAYNLSGGETVSYRRMVERIFQAEGIGPIFLQIPMPLFRFAMNAASLWPPYRYLSGEMVKRMAEDLRFDHAEATNDFGYCPRAFVPPPVK